MDSMHSSLSHEINIDRLEGVVDHFKTLNSSDIKQMLETSVLECYNSTLKDKLE
jgi:hypothetical protein